MTSFRFIKIFKKYNEKTNYFLEFFLITMNKESHHSALEYINFNDEIRIE